MKRHKIQVNKRKEEAIERLAQRIKRSPQEQLALVKNRRGKSKKETARLKEQIKNQPPK